VTERRCRALRPNQPRDLGHWPRSEDDECAEGTRRWGRARHLV